MVEKVLAEVYFTYGKGDGETLSEWYVVDNTPEERKSVLDGIYYDDSYSSEDEFINGRSDIFAFDRFGGDWDEPTGGYVRISTKEELISEIEKDAEAKIERINDLFNGE